MFSYVVQADNLVRLTTLVKDLLHHGWILAGGICFDVQSYLETLTRSSEEIWNIQL
jgi:hypothetical protein